MEVLYCALGNLAGHHWVKGSSGHFCCDHAKARLRNHVRSHLVCDLPPLIPGQKAAANKGPRSPESTRNMHPYSNCLRKLSTTCLSSDTSLLRSATSFSSCARRSPSA